MKNIICEKSIDFAVDIIECVKTIKENHKEYLLSRQIMRSGASIGASIMEAQEAESDMDFIHKLRISLKEASETKYWLILLKRSKYIDEGIYSDLTNKCIEILKLLTSIINTKLTNIALKKSK